MGLGLIVPILIYQVDYDIPLPLANAWVPVAAALALGVPGAWGAFSRRGVDPTPGTDQSPPGLPADPGVGI